MSDLDPDIGRPPTGKGQFALSPLFRAMTLEEIVKRVPRTYGAQDGDPFRLFPNDSTCDPLAGRLARAAFYWQIQPVDAVRALAPGGHRFTFESVMLWLLGERTLATWEASTMERLVHMLENPESVTHVQAWWSQVNDYLEGELLAFERLQARRCPSGQGGSRTRRTGRHAVVPAPQDLSHPSMIHKEER